MKSKLGVSNSQPKTVDQYINSFPERVKVVLHALRRVIKEEAPEAKETIKYRIPTFTLNGNLIHFAAFKNHIGFYPTPSPLEVFKKELSKYQTSKGAIQFPIDQPLPFPLIRKIVRFRVKENSAH